jgi:hypothetical protein
MVSACLEAFRTTSDPWWHEQAHRAFDWFLGWNDLGLELYSPNTGGCRDALHVDRVNGNQGAESTLAFLLALAEMRIMQNAVTVFREPRPAAAPADEFTSGPAQRSRPSSRARPRAGPAVPNREPATEGRTLLARDGDTRERSSQAAREVESGFGRRHLRFRELLLARFDELRSDRDPCCAPRRIPRPNGSCCSERTSRTSTPWRGGPVQSSIVPHPDQSDVPPGSLRFILSLRATGEGHISSITFRTGYVDERGAIAITTRSRYCIEGTVASDAAHEKALLARRLEVRGLVGDLPGRVLEGLGDPFTLNELEASVRRTIGNPAGRDPGDAAASNRILELAQSNFEVTFPPETRLSERVLFPRRPRSVTASRTRASSDSWTRTDR